MKPMVSPPPVFVQATNMASRFVNLDVKIEAPAKIAAILLNTSSNKSQRTKMGTNKRKRQNSNGIN